MAAAPTIINNDNSTRDRCGGCDAPPAVSLNGQSLSVKQITSRPNHPTAAHPHPFPLHLALGT
ncbi:hypothetical protein E2C01_088197 [Portunus trituberculatus]|uniref:Uncharacterized protein n=1 Tax=Portunus trituberculatus TaxID=210409 RepID=A0A5B7J5H3_PORTR|nr:hypothetical protein [Portunus trituberculatus]